MTNEDLANASGGAAVVASPVVVSNLNVPKIDEGALDAFRERIGVRPGGGPGATAEGDTIGHVVF